MLARFLPCVASVFAMSSDWLVVLFTSVVVGQSNHFGLDFIALKKKTRSKTTWIECFRFPGNLFIGLEPILNAYSNFTLLQNKFFTVLENLEKYMYR